MLGEGFSGFTWDRKTDIRQSFLELFRGPKLGCFLTLKSTTYCINSTHVVPKQHFCLFFSSLELSLGYSQNRAFSRFSLVGSSKKLDPTIKLHRPLKSSVYEQAKLYHKNLKTTQSLKMNKPNYKNYHVDFWPKNPPYPQ